MVSLPGLELSKGSYMFMISSLSQIKRWGVFSRQTVIFYLWKHPSSPQNWKNYCRLQYRFLNPHTFAVKLLSVLKNSICLVCMRKKRHMRTSPQPLSPCMGLTLLMMPTFLAHCLASRQKMSTSLIYANLAMNWLLMMVFLPSTVMSILVSWGILQRWRREEGSRDSFKQANGADVPRQVDISQGKSCYSRLAQSSSRKFRSLALMGWLQFILRSLAKMTVRSMSQSCSRPILLLTDPNSSKYCYLLGKRVVLRSATNSLIDFPIWLQFLFRASELATAIPSSTVLMSCLLERDGELGCVPSVEKVLSMLLLSYMLLISLKSADCRICGHSFWFILTVTSKMSISA